MFVVYYDWAPKVWWSNAFDTVFVNGYKSWFRVRKCNECEWMVPGTFID